MRVMTCARASALGVLMFAAACATSTAQLEPTPLASTPVLNVAQTARLMPAHVVDKEGWANDVLAAISLTKRQPTAERVCAVLAVLEQESGYHADPVVPRLPAIVRAGLLGKLEPLGVLAPVTLAALLELQVPGSDDTFGTRVDALRTERDLDRLFRDLKRALQQRHPSTFVAASALASLLGRGSIDDLNPVTTAGSMQVKVTFARELGGRDGLDDDDARELLYTRGGGVRYGTARLIGYGAHYDNVLYRFADYNAGMYSSRNAAFQEALSTLTGTVLVPDGDLLAYDKAGTALDIDSKSVLALLDFAATHGLSARTVRHDVALEKQQSFEDTQTYQQVRTAIVKQQHHAAPYARVPQVSLNSPKMKTPRTTQWFAEAVNHRYLACRAKT